MDSQIVGIVGDIITRRRKRRIQAVLSFVETFVERIQKHEEAERMLERRPTQLTNDVAFNGKYKVSDFVKYLVAVDKFNEEQMHFCRQLLAGIDLGLKHHTLNCISLTNAFPSLIGMSKEEFFLLILQLEQPLQDIFPGSPISVTKDSQTSVCEMRFKVFIVLYRLRHATSFSCLEAQFGWAASAIHEWWQRVMRVLHQHLFPFHRGFLDFKGRQWQIAELSNWKAYHEQLTGDYVGSNRGAECQARFCRINRCSGWYLLRSVSL